MKKVAVALILATVSCAASAQHYGYGGYRAHRDTWSWAPFIGGAAAGAVVYDAWQRPVMVQPAPVIVSPTPPTPIECTGWVEVQNYDGTITRTRSCMPRPY